jgi:hypothetical protein
MFLKTKIKKTGWLFLFLSLIFVVFRFHVIINVANPGKYVTTKSVRGFSGGDDYFYRTFLTKCFGLRPKFRRSRKYRFAIADEVGERVSTIEIN